VTGSFGHAEKKKILSKKWIPPMRQYYVIILVPWEPGLKLRMVRRTKPQVYVPEGLISTSDGERRVIRWSSLVEQWRSLNHKIIDLRRRLSD